MPSDSNVAEKVRSVLKEQYPNARIRINEESGCCEYRILTRDGISIIPIEKNTVTADDVKELVNSISSISSYSWRDGIVKLIVEDEK